MEKEGQAVDADGEKKHLPVLQKQEKSEKKTRLQIREEEKRKFYIITELGKELLELEIKRIARLYANSKGGIWNGTEKN